MKAIIQNHYTVELVNFDQEDANVILHISYSCQKHPDFKDFLVSSVYDQIPILYQDEIKSCKLFVKGFSFSLSKTRRNSLVNDDIVLRKEIYGEIINLVPKENRKNFILTQAYGVIRAQIL